MSEEIVIIAVKPKMCDIHDEPEAGTWSFGCDYEKELYEVNQPITHRQEYLAVRDPDICYIELFYRIDQAKSKFQKGQIVPEGKPKKVSIPLRVENRSLVRSKIWYASFETLLTHNSTDEFTVEKSSNFTRVKPEDQRVLCNGSSCNHFRYCKFFNHSQSPILQSQNKVLEPENCIQVFKEDNKELTFEKNNGFRKGQDKSQTQYNVTLNKNGRVFVAKDLREDLYALFLNKITNGETVDAIEDLIVLFSELN